MATFLPRVDAVLKRLDQCLAHFAAMITQQRGLASQSTAGAALLKQMLFAQTVVEERRRDLAAALASRSTDRFLHELWALGGDMTHFDFDLRHLAGADTLTRLREEISLEALMLTRDLSDPTHMAVLVSELGP